MGRHVRTIHQGGLAPERASIRTTSFTGVTGARHFAQLASGITTAISQLAAY